jgi:hypothetical protein
MYGLVRGSSYSASLSLLSPTSIAADTSPLVLATLLQTRNRGAGFESPTCKCNWRDRGLLLWEFYRTALHIVPMRVTCLGHQISLIIFGESNELWCL